MSETGVVKFTCEHVAKPLGTFAGLEELNACRRHLHRLGLIGVGCDGIGFGNLSLRDGSQFVISGSGTGALEELGAEHYARVTAFDLERNWLRCEGGSVASSESLTHAALYATDRTIGAVIHGHSAQLWQQLIGVLPATGADVEYGTPAMAAEVCRLFVESNLRERRMFVMAGHEEGFVAFGQTVSDALELVTSTVRHLSS